jgi:hypothetical protein
MGETTEEKRQEDLNHLCRFVVAGLLMAFGQYGRDGAVQSVSSLWKETERP